MTEQSDTVTEVIDGRMSVYGDPVVEMPNVAKVWSGITGAEITAEMVPLMLIGYKLVRARQTPDYSDNSDDVEGYLDIFRKVVGPDMIHARSVSDYLAEVERRQRVATAQAARDLWADKEKNRQRVEEQVQAARDLGLDSERIVGEEPLPGFEQQYDSSRGQLLPGDFEKASESWVGWRGER